MSEKLAFRCFIGWHKWGYINPTKVPSFEICELCKRIVTPCSDGFDVYMGKTTYERCVERLTNAHIDLSKEEQNILEAAKPI